ncbi:YceK/YidQ family lipoprotein [Candidatus Uabimicrobium sp. HlEnr_7]|uniref:YceK/YidQ family lipoprotein n=1 Tax=Candidatus Uabimicrobium helgolandensis TaxID=3095367 RepID=UPI003558F009
MIVDLKRLVRTKCLILVFIVSTIFCGCGTLINISSPVKSESGWHRVIEDGEFKTAIPQRTGFWLTSYYGGARFDVSITRLAPWAIPLCIIDLPLSLVFDTVTLPVVALKKYQENAWQKSRKSTTIATNENQLSYEVEIDDIFEESDFGLSYSENGKKKVYDTKATILDKRTVEYHLEDGLLHITFPFSLDKGSSITIDYLAFTKNK